MTMFKQIFPTLLIPVILLGAGCAQNQPEPQPEPVLPEPTAVEEEAFIDGAYVLDASSGSIAWNAQKRVGAKHNGRVQAQEGAMLVEQGTIIGGSIVVGMSTIIDLDLTSTEFNTLLVDDLKSDNFFDVATYPTATFALSQVTSVEGLEGASHRLDGTMTIKGINREVSFPASVEARDEGIRVKGTLTLDRTLFDVRFGSDKFFDNLGDELIEDEFMLTVDMLFVQGE